VGRSATGKRWTETVLESAETPPCWTLVSHNMISPPLAPETSSQRLCGRNCTDFTLPLCPRNVAIASGLSGCMAHTLIVWSPDADASISSPAATPQIISTTRPQPPSRPPPEGQHPISRPHPHTKIRLHKHVSAVLPRATLSSIPRAIFCRCFRSQIFEPHEIYAVCRLFMTARKMQQTTEKTAISEKSAEQH